MYVTNAAFLFFFTFINTSLNIFICTKREKSFTLFAAKRCHKHFSLAHESAAVRYRYVQIDRLNIPKTNSNRALLNRETLALIQLHPM